LGPLKTLTEQATDPLGRTINSGMEIEVGLLNSHPSEGLEFRGDAATFLCPTARSVQPRNLYDDAAYPVAIPAQLKTQPLLDISLQRIGQISIPNS
jgi:hypothetical protein